MPPDHPLAQGGATPPPAPEPPGGTTSSCLTPQPVSNWVCVNGGWLPPDHPLANVSPSAPAVPTPVVVQPTICTTAQPAATWVCVNGGWLPPDNPLAGAAPAPPPSTGSPLLWVMVINESGGCIEGATIQIIGADGPGDPIPQTTPCTAWDVDGGLLLTDSDLTLGVEVTLRGAAVGYAPHEMTFLPMGVSQAVFIILSESQ